jgi:threonine/homoserine/homoserine lactone efflux protein
MVTALLIGLVAGFVMVMPPGPIALACIRQALAGRSRTCCLRILFRDYLHAACVMTVSR